MYIFASKLAGYAIRLLLPFFLVRLLTVAEFGAYRQFFLLEMYIGAIFQLGLTQALYYFIPRDTRNAGAYFINSLLMNSVVLAIAFVGIGLASDQLSGWLNMEILKDAYWQLVIYVTAMVLSIAGDSYLVARQRVKAAALFEILGQSLVSVVCVAVAYTTRSLDAVLAGLVIARVIVLALMLGYVHWGLRGFGAERYFFGIREQLKYGVVLGASGTMFSLLARMHEFFVSRYYGTEAYGIYSAGCTELPLIQIFVQSIGTVSLGQFAMLEKNGDWEGIRQLWRRVLTGSYAVAIPVILLMIVLASPIVRFMFTDAYAAAVPIFQVNSLVKIGLVFNSALILRAIRRNDVSIWTNAITLLLAAPVLYVGMKLGGMVGIIAAHGALMVGCRLAGNVAMNRIIPVHMPYLAGFGDMREFYVTSWGAVRARVASRLSGLRRNGKVR